LSSSSHLYKKIQLLADIIELQTENNNEIEVCHYLKNLFDKYDINSKILKVNEQRANIVAEIGSGSPILALSGHMDVVDAGNQDNWTYPPFQLTEKDGKANNLAPSCSFSSPAVASNLMVP
jgi:succinyl-diaminopimelate desuccinylase